VTDRETGRQADILPPLALVIRICQALKTGKVFFSFVQIFYVLYSFANPKISPHFVQLCESRCVIQPALCTGAMPATRESKRQILTDLEEG